MNLFYQRDNRDKWVVDDRAFHRLGRLICTFPEIEVFRIKWSVVKSRDIEYPQSDMAAKDYDHLFKLLIIGEFSSHMSHRLKQADSRVVIGPWPPPPNMITIALFQGILGLVKVPYWWDLQTTTSVETTLRR